MAWSLVMAQTVPGAPSTPAFAAASDDVQPEEVVVGLTANDEAGVTIGDGTTIGPRVLIERDTTLGEDCMVANGAVLGTDPQDLKYQGEQATLEIGDRTVIREFATLNRGTAASGRTVVGSDCLLMAYTHVAHDCELGNHVILANSVNMAGHVLVEDWDPNKARHEVVKDDWDLALQQAIEEDKLVLVNFTGFT